MKKVNKLAHTQNPTPHQVSDGHGSWENAVVAQSPFSTHAPTKFGRSVLLPTAAHWDVLNGCINVNLMCIIESKVTLPVPTVCVPKGRGTEKNIDFVFMTFVRYKHFFQLCNSCARQHRDDGNKVGSDVLLYHRAIVETLFCVFRWESPGIFRHVACDSNAACTYSGSL